MLLHSDRLMCVINIQPVSYILLCGTVLKVYHLGQQTENSQVCVFVCYLTTLTVLFLSAGAVEPSNPCAILRLAILFFLAIPGALGRQEQKK